MELGFKEYKEFCRITKRKECDAKSLEKFYSLSHTAQRFLVKKLKDENYKLFCRIFSFNPDKYFTLEIYDQVESYFNVLLALEEAKSTAEYEVNAMIQTNDDCSKCEQFERMEDVVCYSQEMISFFKSIIKEIYEYEQQQDEERGWTIDDIGNRIKKI